MSWLARLIGREPPSIPAGARAFAYDESHVGVRWSIRYVTPPQEQNATCPHVKGAPTFSQQVMAYRYADYVNGEGDFEYPAGAV